MYSNFCIIVRQSGWEALTYALDTASEVANHAAQFGVTCLYEEQGIYINGVKNFVIFMTR